MSILRTLQRQLLKLPRIEATLRALSFRAALALPLALTGFLACGAGPAQAQTVLNPSQVALVCAYNSVVPSPVDGQFYFVQCDSTGKLITSGGGGGSSAITIGTTTITGGTTTRVLYDNAGVVGEYTISGTGSVAMTTAPTFTAPVNLTGVVGSSALTITGVTQTSSFPVLNLSQTWNNVATTFEGIVFNATDTTSAAASLLINLKVGGTSQFSIGKAGGINIAQAASQTLSITPAGQSALLFKRAASSVGLVQIGQHSSIATGVIGSSDATYAWSSSSTNVTTPDLILSRAAAASLQLGAVDAAAPVAQTLGVQSVVAGTSNTNGTDFTIKGSAGTGTGTGGSLVFQVAPAGTTGTAQNALASYFEIAAPAASQSTARLVLKNNGNGPVLYQSAGGGLSLGSIFGSPGILISGQTINLVAATTLPAGGSTSGYVKLGSTGGLGIYFGSGAPTIAAVKGSIYLRSDGSGTSDRMYINTDGSTTWTAVTTAA